MQLLIRSSKFFFHFVFVLLLLILPLSAQSLTPEQIQTSTGGIAKLLEENYVFPDKGKKIAAHFLSEHRSGKFSRSKDWSEFSRLATETMQSFSGDRHLYVRYDPARVKELNAPPKPGSDAKSAAEDPFFYSPKAREKNYGFATINILEGNIGYLKLSEINISGESLPVLSAAMRFVANTRALIIDLRDNGGGGSEIGAVMESFFLPKNISLLEFRDRKGIVETAKTVAWLSEKKYDAPLYIIINGKTGSAAEALAYVLQAKKRAFVVGQPSSGAAHMNSWYAVNDSIFVSVSTAAPVLPGTELSWEGKGVQPDFPIPAGQEIEFIKTKIGRN